MEVYKMLAWLFIVLFLIMGLSSYLVLRKLDETIEENWIDSRYEDNK